MMKNFNLGAILTVGMLLMLPGASTASPIFSCGGGSKCDGNSYALYVTSHVGDTWQLEFDIKVLGTYTGNKWSDVVNAVEIKNFAPVFTNASLIFGPSTTKSGTSWFFDTVNELGANGCAQGNSDPACIQAQGAGVNPGATFTDGDILSWLIQFHATTLNDTATIKYLYMDTSGKKVGDLGSWEIGIQRQVPEPATLALMGLGLFGIGVRRKFKR